MVNTGFFEIVFVKYNPLHTQSDFALYKITIIHSVKVKYWLRVWPSLIFLSTERVVSAAGSYLAEQTFGEVRVQTGCGGDKLLL